jgi:hypothetical protein
MIFPIILTPCVADEKNFLLNNLHNLLCTFADQEALSKRQMTGWIIPVLFCLYSGLLHPVHVSLSAIDIKPETGEIAIAIKLFADDFESIVNQKYNTKLKLMEGIEPGQDIYYINRYIDSSFVLTINGKKIEGLIYERNQMSEGAIWLFYKHDSGTSIGTITINNSLMCDLYQDQTNLVILTVRDEQKGYRMNNKDRELTVKI